MSQSTLALVTVPIVTGVIGYVTNWTGVLMLFYPVRFRGWRVPGVQTLVRMLPRRLQQIPGVMVGGIGWQGIVPSRAAKMGSLAVDSGIAKIGRPNEFFNQLEPDRIAEQIIVSARQDLPAIVDGIMEREQPRLWQELPLRLLATEGSQPAVDVRASNLIGMGSELLSGGINMIGAHAGCQHRARVPAYLNNLERLGLARFSREPVGDPVAYQVLEAQPEVLDAMRTVSRTKTVQPSIHLTSFGEDFCAVCLPLDIVETNAFAEPDG